MGPSHSARCEATHSADEPRPSEWTCTYTHMHKRILYTFTDVTRARLDVPISFFCPAWFSMFLQCVFRVCALGEHG